MNDDTHGMMLVLPDVNGRRIFRCQVYPHSMMRLTMIDRTARLPLWLFFPLASALAATGCSVSAPTNDAETSGGGRGSRLTLERLYSLPRLIGTAPKGAVWSTDGSKVAFLWNDAGANFYDVWTMDRDRPSPARLSTFERPAAPGDSTDIDARRKAIAAEQAPGVAFVLWFPDGSHLLAGFRGDLYALDLSGHGDTAHRNGRRGIAGGVLS